MTCVVQHRPESFVGGLVRVWKLGEPRREIEVPRIPVALDRAVLRALSKDRCNRYASATELADALRALGEHGRGAHWRRWAVMGGVVGIAAGVGAWMTSGTNASTDAPPTHDEHPSRVDVPEPNPQPEPRPEPGRPPEPTVPDDSNAAAALPEVTDVDPVDATNTGSLPAELPAPPGTSTGPALPGLEDPPSIDELEPDPSPEPEPDLAPDPAPDPAPESELDPPLEPRTTG